MLKEFTREGRFECGLDDAVRGKLWCFTVGNHEFMEGDGVIKPGKWSLGIAFANEPGYMPVPLTWCHADKRAELALHVDDLNAGEGVGKEMALAIIASTHASRTVQKAPPANVLQFTKVAAIGELAASPGDLRERTRAVIEALAGEIDDRRRLLVTGPMEMIALLIGALDWLAVPGCFRGDAHVKGSFAGVPVMLDDEAPLAFSIVLAGKELASVPMMGAVRRTAFVRSPVGGDAPAGWRDTPTPPLASDDEAMRVLVSVVRAAGGVVRVEPELLLDAASWWLERVQEARGGFTLTAYRRDGGGAAALSVGDEASEREGEERHQRSVEDRGTFGR